MKTLAALAVPLTLLGACATATSQENTPLTATAPAARIVVESEYDFAETDRRLAAAIASRGFNLFTVVDHGAGAESVDLPLGATKLYIFGNPRGGTPVMQANRQFGLDLPLKALVYEDAGKTYVATPNMVRVFAEYGVDSLDQVRINMTNALAGIAAEAAGTSG